MIDGTVGLALVVVTLVAFTLVGLRLSSGRVDSVEDLITARNSTGRRRMAATLIASVMGVWILLSAPEAGALYGIAAVVGYGIGEAVPMLAYSWLGPRIRRLIPQGHSLTEYAYVRYGPVMYGFVLFVSVLYMFVFLAAELTGISLALEFVAGIPQWQTAVLVGGFVLVYTGYGGLQASIATDTIQTLIVLPLLAVTAVTVVLALGGLNASLQGVAAANPALLDPGYVPGLRFGAALVFGILGAELLNQTWWQRVFAADGPETVARGFRVASVTNGLILVVATLLGVIAVGNADLVTAFGDPEYNAGIAFFLLLDGAVADAVLVVVALLALALVASTADTLFAALASVITVDLPRLLADPDDRTLRVGARLLIVVIAAAAVLVSLRARSVLRLFFLADLLGAAVGVPLVYGLVSGRLSGTGALASSLGGLAVGAAVFPFPFGLHAGLNALLGGLLPAPDPTYLLPFGGAFLVSTLLALGAARLPGREFDLDRLTAEIRRLDEPVTDGGPTDGADTESTGEEPPR